MLVADRARPRLVVLRPLGVGDLLTGVPALRALATAFPEHERILACPAVLEPLALIIGEVDRVVDTQPLVPLARELHRADVAVDLHGKGPASHRVLLASQPRRLVAFATEQIVESADMPEWRADEHEVLRWCRMLTEQGIPADPRDLYIDPPTGALPPEAVGATIVHPSAASPSRRWPAERFARVARAELERGRAVFFTGTTSERARAEEVARLAGGGCVLAGRTDLAGLAVLVAAAGLIVSGDTGVAHLATAFRIPSIVLFGPTSPAHWGPPPGDPRHVALWAGRLGDPHAHEPDPGLLDIDAEHVLAAVAALNEQRAAA